MVLKVLEPVQNLLVRGILCLLAFRSQGGGPCDPLLAEVRRRMREADEQEAARLQQAALMRRELAQAEEAIAERDDARSQLREAIAERDDARAQLRELLEHVRRADERAAEEVHDRARRRTVGFNVCLDFQCPKAIESLQFLIAGFDPIGGYGLKGHLATIGGTNVHVIQISNGEPLYLWITHHDLDVFSPSGNTLGFRTIKRLPHLPRHIRQTHTQCFGRRF